MESKELTESPFTQVSPNDEPSARWGWHGTFPRVTRVMTWFAAILCILMALFGNQQGHVEDFFLFGCAALLIGGSVAAAVRRRTSWRR
ncbi:DUF2631 domain-containing protein [Sciscionella marina]|uniref:DUF2631 domain-containing protein n=1 Tax=Sciscionella marina TaxID=508770 RepID=UPI0007C4B988|nr:DUF2631 domain-containing protein [Sciscionella marina]